jgi:recombination protein RecA
MNSFIKDFEKQTAKMDGVSTYNEGPKFWVDSGNIIINKIISGKYNGGFAQGRLACLAGHSGAGKSFLAANAMASAQQNNGAGILLLDSENALDSVYLSKVGVDTTASNFLYRGVKSIADASKIISAFIKSYRAAETDETFLILIDSLDMLMTESMLKTYDEGDIGTDQGQHAKQLKRMLATYMHDIKDLNIVMLCTKQPYKEQDPIKARSNPWVLTESSKFPFSQILLLTKLVLKDKKTNELNGITLKVFGEKTRFTKPFQQCKIEVPYNEGMDRMSGLLDAAVALNVVEKNKAWYGYGTEKFQESNFDKIKDKIFQEVLAREEEFLNVEINEKMASEETTLAEKRLEILAQKTAQKED